MSKRMLLVFCLLSLALFSACDGGGCGPEPDADGDGIVDGKDNCPRIANPDQLESENLCDAIFCSADGIGDPCDNCPLAYNPDQADSDRDGRGDACDDPSASCLSNAECKAADLYCAKALGACDTAGLCQAKPQACYDLWQPVCGCDGRTYGNDCNAAAAGVAVDYEGECCPADACGPALGMPNYLCEDGVTVAGPTGKCRRNAEGACRWEIVQCP